MKKFLFSLVVMAFAANTMTAQIAQPVGQPQVKKECCKKEGEKKCDKPAAQQCPECKAQAAAPQQECKKAEGQCKKAEGQCKKAEGQCKKAEGQCKKDEGQCKKDAAPQQECKKADGQCKGHDGGQACNKPADQQCPECKAKKN